MSLPLEDDQVWPGIEQRTCGDHRPLGVGYSWCYQCAERCSADIPCDRCELPGLRAERDQLQAVVGVLREYLRNSSIWARQAAGHHDIATRHYARAQLAIFDDINGTLMMAPAPRERS